MFNGTEIPDSNFIVQHLSEYFKKDQEEGLSPEQQAIARSFLKMAEDSTTWLVCQYHFWEEQVVDKSSKY